MEPALYEGDLVVYLRKKPIIGDIVAATVSGREVIKRVIDISTTHFVLAGDNASHSTDSRQYGPVPRSAIIGVVIIRIKNHQKK